MATDDKETIRTFSSSLGFTFVSVDLKQIDACLRYWSEHHEYGIHLSRERGYKSDDIDILARCQEVPAVSLQDPVDDPSVLYSLGQLRYLSYSGSTKPLDLSRLRQLEMLRADWGPKLINLGECVKLHHLFLRLYKPASRNLEELAHLSHVDDFELVQSTIESLDGIEQLRRLRHAEFHYCTRLRDISAVRGCAATLENLRFGCCKRIEDVEQLCVLKKLRILGFDSCGEIPTVDFVRHLKRLELLSFVGTKVSDGDFSALTKHPSLGHVGMRNSAHYSHREAEIREIVSRPRRNKE